MRYRGVITKTLIIDKNGCICDHKGNKFTSVPAMCAAWGVSNTTFRQRIIKSGYSLEKALTYKNGNHGKVVGDAICVFGTYYPHIQSIADAYALTWDTVSDNLKDIEGYLTNSGNLTFEGIRYGSLASLSAKFGVGIYTLRQRLSRGWSLHDALHTPVGVQGVGNCRPCRDHLGNEFDSKSSMCGFWGVPAETFTKRISRHWSLEKALTTPVRLWRLPAEV